MSVVWHSIPLRPSQLSLAHVLKSGQSFRWTHTPLDLPSSSSSPPSAPTEYSLCLPDRLILLRQSTTHLHYSAVFPHEAEGREERERGTERWVRDYLRLDVDLEELYRTWGEKDLVFRKEEGGGGVLEGVAVLRQDPWECLFSFICSSNNNIPRITSMVQSAARHFSPPLLSYPSSSSIASSSTPISTSTTYHPFPPPSAFSSPSIIPILRDLGFGYRAPFIQRTAAMLVEEHLEPEEWLRELRGWETRKAREELLRFLGVGRKVADCVLLMSMDKNDIIPIDVHVHQIAQRLYNFRPSSAALPGGKRKASSGEKIPMTPKLYEEVQNSLSERWGAWGGWTQAVLFASDLPFLLFSLAPNSTKPLKQPLIRSSHLSSSSLSEGLVALPESMLPSTPPPETKPVVKIKVEGGGSGRLGFASSKKSSSTSVSRKVKGGTELEVVVKEEVEMELSLGLGLGEEEGGGSLGERIKRRRRNAGGSTSSQA